jgi:hypothetical protein
MQIRPAVLAGVRNLDLIRDLDFRRAIVAACNQMEARFDARSGSFGTRRGLRPFFAVVIMHVAALTILSAHFSPQKQYSGEDLHGRGSAILYTSSSTWSRCCPMFQAPGFSDTAKTDTGKKESAGVMA